MDKKPASQTSQIKKSQLIKIVAAKTGSSENEAGIIINQTFETLTDLITSGRPVHIQGFCKFIPITKNKRQLTVQTVKFIPSKSLVLSEKK